MQREQHANGGGEGLLHQGAIFGPDTANPLTGLIVFQYTPGTLMPPLEARATAVSTVIRLWRSGMAKARNDCRKCFS